LIVVPNPATGFTTAGYVGNWIRPSDFAVGASVSGRRFFVLNGKSRINTEWLCTSAAGSDVVGTNTLTFQKQTYNNGPNLDFSKFTLYAKPASTFYLFGSSTTPQTYSAAGLQAGAFVDNQPANEIGHALVVATSPVITPNPSKVLGQAYVAATVPVPIFGEIAIDGFSIQQGQRILLTAQTNRQENGLWIVQAPYIANPADPNFATNNNPSGLWKRPPDYEHAFTGELNSIVYIAAGTFANTAWMCTEVDVDQQDPTAGVDVDITVWSQYPLIDSVVVPVGSRVLLTAQPGSTNGFVQSSGGTFTGLAGTKLGVSVDGGPAQTVTFDASAVGISAVMAEINQQLTCASASVFNNVLTITSNSFGAQSTVSIAVANAAAGFPTTGPGTPGTASKANGLWLANAGPWTRPGDFQSAGHALNSYVFVDSGTVNKGTAWMDTSGDVIDTDGLTFHQQGVCGAPPIPPAVSYGYLVPTGYSDSDIYLASETASGLTSHPVVRVLGSDREGLMVTAQRSASVTFQKKERIPSSSILVDPQGRSSSVVTDTYPITETNAFVTVIRFQQEGQFQGAGAVESRLYQDIRNSSLLADWQVVVPFVAVEPNQTLANGDTKNPQIGLVTLDAFYASIVPSRYIALSTLDGTTQEIARVTHVNTDPLAPADSTPTAIATYDATKKTVLQWEVIDPPSTDPQVLQKWELGNLKFHGNVAHISNGKTLHQTLGGSDGVTPFLRFALQEKPLTYLPGATTTIPSLSIAVGGVTWSRVDDFFDSGPHDINYKLERDEQHNTFVLFGDGIHGAVPPSGEAHIQATYRIGLGLTGNNPAGVVNRIKQASPLLESVNNARAIGGGADAANANLILTQATRYIRTFDRAVSVSDHADLALLFPGGVVARAQARFGLLGGSGPGGIESDKSSSAVFGIEGVQVIVATADGGTPEELNAIHDFLATRRDNSVPLFVDGPNPVDVFVSLYFENDPKYVVDNVKVAIRNALMGAAATNPGLLTFASRDLGQPLFLSEMFQTVLSVPGVTFVDIQELDTRQLEPGRIDITTTPEVTKDGLHGIVVTGTQDTTTRQYTHFTFLKPGMSISVDAKNFFEILQVDSDNRMIIRQGGVDQTGKPATAPVESYQQFVTRQVADVIHAQPDQWLRLQAANFTFVGV
jgi:hypothetical protein